MEENIKEYGNMMLQDEKGHKIQMISIIGEIEGHESSSNTTKTTKYEHMLPMLASLDCTKQVHWLLLMECVMPICLMWFVLVTKN